MGSSPPPPETVRDRARADLTWFIRHAEVLRRWPVIGEDWARRIEERRIEEDAPRSAVYLHGVGR